MTTTVEIVADSISQEGIRLPTFQLRYPRLIHSEFMTHRVFSRNASSSRAIPVAKMIEQVRNDPAMPIHWGKNQAGMQAREEIQHVGAAKDFWLLAANQAADIAEEMMNLGLHKQVANRILEPYQYISVILTSTEWYNFFSLRAHEDADPNIHDLAIKMKVAAAASTPKELQPGEWHLPYVTDEDRRAANHGPSQTPEWGLLRKISAARCCRVSYLKHDGTKASIEEDLTLCDRLAGAVPIHASPFEHQATPDYVSGTHRNAKTGKWEDVWDSQHLHGNFTGWIQNRKILEQKLYR